MIESQDLREAEIKPFSLLTFDAHEILAISSIEHVKPEANLVGCVKSINLVLHEFHFYLCFASLRPSL